MRVQSSETPPCSALTWPSSEVPAPKGTIGASWAAQMRTASITSSRLSANTTASGGAFSSQVSVWPCCRRTASEVTRPLPKRAASAPVRSATVLAESRPSRRRRVERSSFVIGVSSLMEREARIGRGPRLTLGSAYPASPSAPWARRGHRTCVAGALCYGARRLRGARDGSMDWLTGMRVFVRVVEAGGFSRAADDLAMAQPAVSKHVAAIEKALNCRLVNRNTRGVAVTETGALYYERCKATLARIRPRARDGQGRPRRGERPIARDHVARLRPARADAGADRFHGAAPAPARRSRLRRPLCRSRGERARPRAAHGRARRTRPTASPRSA